jgi:hypothetical protein
MSVVSPQAPLWHSPAVRQRHCCPAAAPLARHAPVPSLRSAQHPLSLGQLELEAEVSTHESLPHRAPRRRLDSAASRLADDAAVLPAASVLRSVGWSVSVGRARLRARLLVAPRTLSPG